MSATAFRTALTALVAHAACATDPEAAGDDLDLDGFTIADGDCDDRNATVHPVDPLTGWLLTVRRPAPIADHVGRVLRACEPALRQTATADLPDRLEALFAQGWWRVAPGGSTNA